jgi:hypothetical protein
VQFRRKTPDPSETLNDVFSTKPRAAAIKPDWTNASPDPETSPTTVFDFVPVQPSQDSRTTAPGTTWQNSLPFPLLQDLSNDKSDFAFVREQPASPDFSTGHGHHAPSGDVCDAERR